MDTTAHGAQGPPAGELDGPWDQAFWCSLPFPLRSKSNFRRGGQRSSAQWQAEQRFRSDVANVVGAALPGGWDPGDAADPVARRPVMVVALVAASPLDTANLSKSVLDALEGLVFVNDAQVRAETAMSERRRGGQSAVLAAARLDPAATMDHLAAAAAALTAAALAAWSPA